MVVEVEVELVIVVTLVTAVITAVIIVVIVIVVGGLLLVFGCHACDNEELGCDKHKNTFVNSGKSSKHC